MKGDDDMARETKMTCLCCGKEKQISRDFYRSPSELYKFSNGRIPICKECLLEHYNELLGVYEGNSNMSFKHWCMTFSIYYDEELYLQCIDKENFIGEYMRMCSSTKDRRDKTSLNNKIPEGNVDVIEIEDGKINGDLILKWGRNRKKEDYVILEKRYNQKIQDYPSKKPAERSIIRSMCLLELDIEEARVSDKKSVPSLEKALSDKFKQLGINPSDNTMYDEQSMLKFGVIMGIIENDYPVMDMQDIYKDVDNMHWYWYRNLIVPTMKAWEMADGDYSLDNGIDNIEVKPEIKVLMEDYKDGK